MNKRQAGFTLVELMVVVSIIGILAAVAIPNYSKYQTRARWVEVMSVSMELKDQINEYYKYHGRFPKNNAEARLPKPEFLIGRFITSIEVEDGVLNVHLGNRIDEQLKGKIVSIRPWVVAGSPKSPISWGCGDEEPVPGMKAVGVDRTSALAEYVPFGCMGPRKK